MKKTTIKSVFAIICALIFVSLFFSEAYARGRLGGSFRMGGSFRSRSFSSKSFGWGGSKRSGFSKSGLSNLRRSGSAKRMSSADRALFNRAKSSGTIFKTRSSALKDFERKYASNYPTRFGSKPNTRPNYIPQTFNKDGKSYRVIFNNGGYGYYAGNKWYRYSPFMDPLMAAGLMSMHGYYYGPRPGLSFMAILGMGLTLLAMMVILRSVAAAAGRQGLKKI